MADDTTGNATVDGAEQTAKETTPQAQTVPYARFQEVLGQKKAAEAALEAVVAELAQDVPEDMRDLIPAGLPAADRAAWIRAAKAKGLFTPPAPANSPDAKRPTGKPQLDLADMTPLQKLQAGYAKK